MTFGKKHDHARVDRRPARSSRSRARGRCAAAGRSPRRRRSRSSAGRRRRARRPSRARRRSPGVPARRSASRNSVSWNEFPPKMSPIASWWSPSRTAAIPLEISGSAVAARQHRRPEDRALDAPSGRRARCRTTAARRPRRASPPAASPKTAIDVAVDRPEYGRGSSGWSSRTLLPARPAAGHLDRPVGSLPHAVDDPDAAEPEEHDRDRGRADSAEARRRGQRCAAEHGRQARRSRCSASSTGISEPTR